MEHKERRCSKVSILDLRGWNKTKNAELICSLECKLVRVLIRIIQASIYSGIHCLLLEELILFKSIS
jgi:hypothetical protein